MTEEDELEEKKRILVVDSRRENIMLLNALLNNELYEVISALNGKDALKKIDDQAPDIILSEVKMPEMDGFEMTATIKQNVDLENIPIILLSTLRDIESLEKGFLCGCCDYIRKPFQAEELLLRINYHLSIADKLNELKMKNK